MKKENIYGEKGFLLEETNDEYIIRIAKIKNYSLEHLKQKTINHLYNSTFLDSNEVNLLKLLLENKSESSECSNSNYKVRMNKIKGCCNNQ